jgi:uncharacterized protein YdaU (DUF1376 family)
VSELPPPLVEAHVDCSDLDGFMLNAERLMSSELLALHGNDVLGAALLLWCRAWKQRPAASLPDDDRINAAFARLSLKKFREVKDAVMRGFVKCSDGRLYHRFLSGEATKAFARKVQFQGRRAADAKRLKEWRDAKRETADETQLETQSETWSETRFVADGNGKDRDRDRDSLRKDSPTESPKESSSKGRRLPPDWRPTDDDWATACRLLGRHKAEIELAKFRDYWPAKPGSAGRKLDWDGTWRNWVRKAAEQLPSGSIAVASAEPAIDLGGEFREVPTRNLPGILKLFEEKGAWPYPTPKPGEPGCRVPSRFLPQPLQATGTNGR